VHVDIVEADGHLAEVDLLEVQRRQRAGEHAREHGLDNVLCHLGARIANVGPENGHEVVEEACRVLI
jgi:hypothetical protein